MENRGLGKGLGALIPGAGREEAAPAELPIENIARNPFQPRKVFDDERFQELVRSVRLHGILQPVVVRSRGGDSYELVAGERRLRAAIEAGLSRIPAVVKDFTDEQSLEIALIENIQREDIGVLEAAAAYRRLVDEFGLTQDEIAFRVGKSRSSIANTLRLLNLPENIQKSLAAGEITEGHARALLAIVDENRQQSVWQEIVRSGLTVRDAERMTREPEAQPEVENVSRETITSRDDTPAQMDPNLASVEEQLRRLFGTKVTITVGRDRGRIAIDFYSEDDLDRILNLLGTV